MRIVSQLVMAAALFAGVAGLQGTTASAMPLAKVDASATADGAHIDHIRWCNWHGCYPGWGYSYRAYAYRPYAYYRPYGYRYGLPSVRLGWY